MSKQWYLAEFYYFWNSIFLNEVTPHPTSISNETELQFLQDTFGIE
jgi:hypothetical protein